MTRKEVIEAVAEKSLPQFLELLHRRVAAFRAEGRNVTAMQILDGMEAALPQFARQRRADWKAMFGEVKLGKEIYLRMIRLARKALGN